MAATSYRQPTSAIVTALQAAVAGIAMPPAFGAGNAFDRVEIFDSEDLVAAFQYLLVTEQRVCVIVPLHEAFTSEAKQTTLIIQRELPVALLIADRVLGNRQAALFGDGETTPGAYGLMELALPAVIGIVVPAAAPLTKVVAVPKSATVMSVKDTESELPMRLTVALELECRGGRIEVPIGTAAF